VAAFPERQRLVYRYHNGAKEVFADPLVLRRKMIQAGRGELNQILREAVEPAAPTEEGADSGDAGGGGGVGVADECVRLQAQERRAQIVYEAFGLVPFDPETGGGVTEIEAIAVLHDFLGWLEGNASRAGNSPR
jgi:hypothetical protein